MNEPWNECPIVEVEYPPCPHCGCSGYVRVRTEACGDGTKFHKAICCNCSQRFKVFFQLPPWGRTEGATE